MAEAELLNGAAARPAVLVVGSAGALGGALVRAFWEAGWSVSAGWHCQKPDDALPDGLLIQLDASDSTSVERGIRVHLAHWKRIDAMVYAAGVSVNALLARHTEADWDEVMRVNLRGAYFCARAAINSMRLNQRGHIVLVGSFVGRSGSSGQIGYATSKAALHGLAQDLARNAGVDNIQVNVVLPGILESKMTRDLPASMRTAWTQAHVLGRLGDAGEVARFIVFLCGMHQISGQVFQLDSRLGSLP